MKVSFFFDEVIKLVYIIELDVREVFLGGCYDMFEERGLVERLLGKFLVG